MQVCASTSVGKYRLVRQLGRSSVAAIYLGEHVETREPVAVKILNEDCLQEEVAKFLAQASILAQLQHPNIIRVLDAGMEGEHAYLVMNYAANGTLRQRHPKGNRVPLDTVLSYVWQVAEALHYIHQRNLIHRDIKPQNMLVGNANEIQLCDFGIAIVGERQEARKAQVYDFEGTVLYAAPEQLRGRPRCSSDLYALGITTYEWLSGGVPFTGSFEEVVHQHLFQPIPPLAERGVSVPQEVEHVIQKVLAKAPEDRFGDALDYAARLERAAKSQGTSLQPPVPSQQETIVSPRRQFLLPHPFPRG